MTGKDWLAWHEKYDEAGSRLAERLATVQHHLRAALDRQPPGPIRLVSLCAGQGRDVLGVLVDHPRRDDVRARLVEIDHRNVEVARAAADALAPGPEVEVVLGDASSTDAYAGAVPAAIVAACGIFGNVSDEDIRATIDELRHLAAPSATVLWTRGGERDRVDTVDGWLTSVGFERVAVQTGFGERPYSVGVHRLTAAPLPHRPGRTMFTFRPDRRPV